MHGIRALLISIGLGVLFGHGLGYFMAEFYWHNDGKTRAITYFYYECLGLAGGVIVGGVALALALTKRQPVESENRNGITRSP